jgi:hypothetical protein
MAHICLNLLSQKLHHPNGRWSFFLVNPNPGEAAKLPKTALSKKWVKFLAKERNYRKLL